MESRNKTHKRTDPAITDNSYIDVNEKKDEAFKMLLEDSAREAYIRPWHRLERGLRLNRLRIFVEDISSQYTMTKDEKDDLFLFLQKALDKKLLNTLKVVNYDQDTQRITVIKGFEIKRSAEGVLKWVFSTKKIKTDTTRKKKKEEVPCVSTQAALTQAAQAQQVAESAQSAQSAQSA